jgi:hypothetical protein
VGQRADVPGCEEDSPVHPTPAPLRLRRSAASAWERNDPGNIDLHDAHWRRAGISLFRRKCDATVTCCLAGFSLRTWAGLPDDGAPVSTSARGPRTGSRMEGVWTCRESNRSRVRILHAAPLGRTVSDKRAAQPSLEPRLGVQLESKRGRRARPLPRARTNTAPIRGASLILEKPAIPGIFRLSD